MNTEKDLLMCTSNNCPLKDNCYRAQGKINLLIEQKYSNLEYICNEENGFNLYEKHLDFEI